MAGGMLSGLFSPQPRDLRPEELDEEKRIADLAVDPFRAAAMTAYGSSRDAGRGLGTAIAAGMGRDPRTPGERQVDAVEAAKAEVAKLGLDPDDPKSIDQFYKQVIMILQKQGLVAEAMEVAKEYQAQKRQGAKEDLGLREAQRKEDRDKRAHELGLIRVASAEEIARAKNVTATDIAEAKLTAKQLETGPFTKVDYGDRVEILNRFNEVISSKPKGAAPMNEKDAAKKEAADTATKAAYGEAKAGMQQQYDAAVELYNHPNVEHIVGPFERLAGEEGAAGQSATTLALLRRPGVGRALALHEQVAGGVFLGGLAKLKAASPTGSAGLGAVSDTEGKKVQAAGVALNRGQTAVDYRMGLKTYIETIEGASTRLDARAVEVGITPIPLNEKPLTGPRRGAKPAPAAPAPTPAPAPAPAAPAAPGGWTPEKERRFQELKRKQNAS